MPKIAETPMVYVVTDGGMRTYWSDLEGALCHLCDTIRKADRAGQVIRCWGIEKEQEVKGFPERETL